MNRIFISYKRIDKKKVYRLKRKIEKATRISCWIDLEGIESDEQFVSVIMNAINEAEIVLFMYSSAHRHVKDYVNDWTTKELYYARKKSKRIVFINLDGSPLTDWFEINFGLMQQTDARSEESINHLICDIRKWLSLVENKQIQEAPKTKTFNLLQTEITNFVVVIKQARTKTIKNFRMFISNYSDQIKKQKFFLSNYWKSKNIRKYLWHLYALVLCFLLILLMRCSYSFIVDDILTDSKNIEINPRKVVSLDTFQIAREKELDKLRNNMVYIKGGTILMGKNLIINDFYLCKYEVTQALWYVVMKYAKPTNTNPSYFKGNNLPVENVSWSDCQIFINRLNKLSKMKYRLPTEAEWEYAARGGNKNTNYVYAGSNNLDEVAWSDKNSHKSTHPVGSLNPNELRLFDMSGNVSEWCATNYSDTYNSKPVANQYAHRGGSWMTAPDWCRIRRRNSGNINFKSVGVGLRLAADSGKYID